MMNHLFPTYARWEVEPAEAKGTKLIDKNGKEYLDFTSGIGVTNLGHRPESVQAAITKQLNKFWHVSNLFTQEQQALAAEKLAHASGLAYTFFANSGAEANEGAIKLAKKATGKDKILTFNKSFHGRTIATMGATGQDKVKQGFGSMLPTFSYATFNDIESVKSLIDHETAAVMVEVVQGEGGIHLADSAFLEELQQLCQEYQALLIIDEIQTGIGRTGKPFAFQHYDLQPDIITCAKGLGSGLPIGAIIGKENLKEYFGPGSHGSTFGGNPLSIASAIATMEIVFNEDFLSEVNEKAEYLLEQLKESLYNIEEVTAIRSLGLMIGIEMNTNTASLLQFLRNDGLLTLSAGENVLRLLPPLTATVEEINQAVAILKKNIVPVQTA
ncbi:acetylornithine transaminase [Cytobacillus kochii]|nr:acetylornithine transaminase [Cytobacillus kochii]MCM3343127.1 acetylornithine transaminase [Cytobacillus kochii]